MVADRGTGNVAKSPRVRTWGGSADRPVVATAPKPYAPTGGLSTQQNARMADAYATTLPYVSGVEQNAKAQAESDRIAQEILGGQSYGGTGTRLTPFQNAMAMLGGGGGVGGGTSAPKASDRLARDEFNYKKEQEAEAKAVRDRALKGMIDQITSGSYRGNIDDLISQINDMETTGKTNVGNIYSDAIKNIGSGYTTAQGLMDTGYGALQAYLQQNQNNPYAGLSAQMPTVTNPMEGYLDAYGAMSPDIAAQIQAEQFAGQQGAGAFQNLINVLSANARQNDLSRLAEAQMARTMGTTGLGAQRASYESQAASRQQDALADLSQRIAQAKFEQEQAAGGRKQSIIDAIIAAGGSIPGTPPPPPPSNQDSGVSQELLDQLAGRGLFF